MYLLKKCKESLDFLTLIGHDWKNCLLPIIISKKLFFKDYNSKIAPLPQCHLPPPPLHAHTSTFIKGAKYIYIYIYKYFSKFEKQWNNDLIYQEVSEIFTFNENYKICINILINITLYNYPPWSLEIINTKSYWFLIHSTKPRINFWIL